MTPFMQLAAAPRKTSTKGALAQLRRSGKIPAIVYGLKETPEPVQVDHKEFSKCLQAGVTNKVIDLMLDGKAQPVMLKLVTRHPIAKQNIWHIDFLRVSDDARVIAKVLVQTTGVPVGVKTEGGQFSVLKRWVKVRCKVQDIPAVFTQDISNMHNGEVVYAKDLVFPQGQILTPAKTALYAVTVSKAEEEVKPAAAAATAAAPAEGKDGKPAAAPAEGKKAEAKSADKKADKKDDKKKK